MKKYLLSLVIAVAATPGLLFSMRPAADQPSAYLAPINFNNSPKETRENIFIQAVLNATKKIANQPNFLSDLPTTPTITKNKKGDIFINYSKSHPKQDLTPGAFNAAYLSYAYTPNIKAFNIYLTTHPIMIEEEIYHVDEIVELEIDLNALPQKTVLVHKSFHNNLYGEFALKLAIEISRELKAKKIEIFDLEKNDPRFSPEEEITGIPWAPELLEKCGFTADANGKWVLNLQKTV
jgi:hypothetical protein